MALAETYSVLPLGFDAREQWSDTYAARWTTDRRTRFLIRPEVALPLSVDGDVWPSVAPSDDRWGLWSSTTALAEALERTSSRRREGPVVIEIAVVTDPDSSGYWREAVQGRLAADGEAANGIAKVLGYDVADEYLVSGLSNCMLSPEELADVRRDWAAGINGFGLFDEASVAFGFRAVCQRLIVEHAPFCVFRIRQIQAPPMHP
jgi:hypothetical protein